MQLEATVGKRGGKCEVGPNGKELVRAKKKKKK